MVRNLSIRDLDKGLSTGEKQMFGRAKKILASELMYARKMDQDEALEFLESLLSEVGLARLEAEEKEKKKAAPKKTTKKKAAASAES